MNPRVKMGGIGALIGLGIFAVGLLLIFLVQPSPFILFIIRCIGWAVYLIGLIIIVVTKRQKFNTVLFGLLVGGFVLALLIGILAPLILNRTLSVVPRTTGESSAPPTLPNYVISFDGVPVTFEVPGPGFSTKLERDSDSYGQRAVINVFRIENPEHFAPIQIHLMEHVSYSKEGTPPINYQGNANDKYIHLMYRELSQSEADVAYVTMLGHSAISYSTVPGEHDAIIAYLTPEQAENKNGVAIGIGPNRTDGYQKLDNELLQSILITLRLKNACIALGSC